MGDIDIVLSDTGNKKRFNLTIMMYGNIQGIKNLMKSYDKDGDYINPTTGLAGLLVTEENEGSRKRIITIPESSKDEMFEQTKKEFLRENGVLNGDTTKRSKLLICSLSMMLLVVGVLAAQGVTQKQTEGQGSTENLLNNANEISKVTEVVLTEEIDNNSAYPSGDLLYREFSQGCELEKEQKYLLKRSRLQMF